MLLVLALGRLRGGTALVVASAAAVSAVSAAALSAFSAAALSAAFLANARSAARTAPRADVGVKSSSGGGR